VLPAEDGGVLAFVDGVGALERSFVFNFFAVFSLSKDGRGSLVVVLTDLSSFCKADAGMRAPSDATLGSSILRVEIACEKFSGVAVIGLRCCNEVGASVLLMVCVVDPEITAPNLSNLLFLISSALTASSVTFAELPALSESFRLDVLRDCKACKTARRVFESKSAYPE
jgi:hypothetical protein